jgi:hypothetical protein
MLCSNGRKTARYALAVSMCVALFFFACGMSNPLSRDKMESLVLQVEVTDSYLEDEMKDIDSIRLRFSCNGLPEPKMYAFSYGAHRGGITGIPVKSTDVEISLAWIDKAGTILYSRDFSFDSLNTDTLVLLISGDSMPPRAPSDLAATVVSAHSVGLTWKSNSQFAKRFVVERGTEGTSEYDIIGSTSIVRFTDSAAIPSAIYTYRVSAVNDAGSSGKIVFSCPRYHASLYPRAVELQSRYGRLGADFFYRNSDRRERNPGNNGKRSGVDNERNRVANGIIFLTLRH